MTPPFAMTTREHLAWLAEYWRPHRLFAAGLVLFTLVSVTVAVSYPLAWKLVIDRIGALPVGKSLPQAELWRLVALLGAIALGRVVAGFYPAFRAWMNLNIEMAVRARVFGSILVKDHTFFGRFRTGDLVTRLTEDITDYPRTAWFSCSGVFRFLDSSARVVFCVGAMVVYCDARLALLAMLPVPLMLWVFYLARKELAATYRAQQEAVSRTNDTLESAFSGVRVVKAFNGAAGQERRLAESLAERRVIQLKLARLVALVHQSDHLASRLGQVIVLSVGGLMVIDGRLTLGTLFALHLYLDMLVQPMMDLPNLFVSAKQAFVSVEREEEVLRAPVVVRTLALAQAHQPIARVTMDGVTFRYPGHAGPALRSVSFNVTKGQMVAVVGAVASGKTTLMRVLAGLLPPEAGTCHYGDRRLDEWHWPAIRARIGYVPQESLLFSETIEDNVSFGRAMDAASVRACLEAAQMGEDLRRIEAGSGARLGHGGTLVSGGQKQRIATARALAGSPEVLLLDDCTSSLDARNEDRLWEGIREQCPGVTIFCVSHRPTTIRKADVVLVLDGGRLVGSGTHEALMRECREYRDVLVTEERRQHMAGAQ
ncbi:MAG: ABC transporter ATP-binding protein [Vicinamibacterales bacterium]